MSARRLAILVALIAALPACRDSKTLAVFDGGAGPDASRLPTIDSGPATDADNTPTGKIQQAKDAADGAVDI
ncbi:MAG: hypothetical protein KJO07_23090, partial [Deltaproteobacteria bacterium]|nr:hypothetical protein [Deltaproteobacteria bacterium]